MGYLFISGLCAVNISPTTLPLYRGLKFKRTGLIYLNSEEIGWSSVFNLNKPRTSRLPALLGLHSSQ